MKLYILPFLFTYILCKTFIWTGNADIYWNNTNNWNPTGLPMYNDIAIIPSNAKIPPYISSPVLTGAIKNHFMINIFNTSMSALSLENHGGINVYISTLDIELPMMTAGKIHLSESTIRTPTINLMINDQLGGTGIIDAYVCSDGLILPHRLLWFRILENFGHIDYINMASTVIADKIILFGKIHIWSPQYLILYSQNNYSMNAVIPHCNYLLNKNSLFVNC